MENIEREGPERGAEKRERVDTVIWNLISEAFKIFGMLGLGLGNWVGFGSEYREPSHCTRSLHASRWVPYPFLLLTNKTKPTKIENTTHNDNHQKKM